MFGLSGGSFALYFGVLLVLLTLIFKQKLLVVVCLAAVLFYFWHPFSGSSSAKSPAPCAPSARAASPLRGPYPSIDRLMQCDGVGPYALQLTGSGTAEYGFVILRDRRR
jgi:hypothetical protein